MFTLSNLIKRGANYLFLVVLARNISVYDMGVFSAYINVVGVVLLITNFGFSEFILVNSDTKKALKENITNFIHVSSMILLLLIIISLMIPLESNYLFFLILIKVFVEKSINDMFLAYHQVVKKINIMTIINTISGLFVLGIVVIYYFFKQSFYIYLIMIDVLYLIILGVLLYKIKFEFISFKNIKNFIKERFSKLKYYGITYMTTPLYMMAPTVIASFVLKPATLALYQVAFSISNILLLISISLLQVRYVRFLELKDNFKELTKALKKTALEIFIINFVVFMTLLIFGKKFLEIVYSKSAYIEAYYPLLFLLICNMIFMFAAIIAVIMVVRKEQKEKSRYHLEFVIISIFFGFLLTYNYGVYGLITSYLILYSYSTIRYSLRYLKISKSTS